MKDARLSSDGAFASQQLPVMRQVAALCHRQTQAGVEVLLISTRGSGRWIIPKGWVITGLSDADSAAREAWEEAGVTGHCDTRRIGSFAHAKHHKRLGRVMCLVDVFPLRVTEVAESFPEAGQRRRVWLKPDEAADRVFAQDLSALIRGFSTVADRVVARKA
ncbi:NUDIX hydrolase [Ruegeria intermedia]|uniref:NUDIX hydrolase n=1 Tax=Ruegeria intermedia TaxID=996115 RepID=UPI001CB708DE|nr:NUDIX hydrolase [Ruegeria intermedia]